MKVLAISDVSLGYGSRQIPALVDFIGNYYDAEKIILEPDQLERPPNEQLFPGINILRLRGNMHPHSSQGRIEYILNATKYVDKIKPEILILCTSFSLPILFKKKFKPEKTIYYSLEMVSGYYGDLDMNKIIDKEIDFIIFPEENRALNHLETTGTELPFCIVYNCVNKNTTEIVPLKQKNGKILYQGGLHKNTAYEYFLENKLQKFPIDIFGLVEHIDPVAKNLILSKFYSLNQKVHYGGYIPFNELEKIRKHYLFSIAIWLPLNENSSFACPNKFFESISNGVPVITAPFPQGELLCKRYDCGILMNDFSFDSFAGAIDRALNIDEKKYEKIVNNCKKAVLNELNWENQMRKVQRLLGKN